MSKKRQLDGQGQAPESKKPKTATNFGLKSNEEDAYGHATLHTAAQFGHKDIALMLIEKGANLNEKDSQGSTPLHLAASDQSINAALMLIENGANLSEKNAEGDTPLHLAAESGHCDVVQMLIENGANPNEKNFYGFTSLHAAAEYGHESTVLTLIENGANPNEKNSQGFTPIHAAARDGHKDAFLMLIENGANIFYKTSSTRGLEHFDGIAAFTAHPEIVNMLTAYHFSLSLEKKQELKLVAYLNFLLRVDDVEQVKVQIDVIASKIKDKKTFDRIIAQGLLVDDLSDPNLPDLIEYCTTLENFGYLTELEVPKWLESEVSLLKEPNILPLFLLKSGASRIMIEKYTKGIEINKERVLQEKVDQVESADLRNPGSPSSGPRIDDQQGPAVPLREADPVNQQRQ